MDIHPSMTQQILHDETVPQNRMAMTKTNYIVLPTGGSVALQ